MDGIIRLTNHPAELLWFGNVFDPAHDIGPPPKRSAHHFQRRGHRASTTLLTALTHTFTHRPVLQLTQRAS
jgi:hypothetical protein